MDTAKIEQRLKLLISARKKVRKELAECFRDLNRREIWKQKGFKSPKQFCLDGLKLDELQTREILIESGLILTAPRMIDSDPAVQSRIDALKNWRRQKALKLKVAPYIILTNRTLMTVARTHPRTAVDLEKIPGLGVKRIELYGRELIKCI